MFDWFRTATPARQIQLIAAGVVTFAVLFSAIWFFFLRTAYQPLFSDLRAADAATIVSVLDRKKIPYRLADGGGTILVPEDMVDSTRLSVMSEDVPLKGTVGFELFNKSDMGLTDFAQKINYQRALQGELERTIMTLDGVDTARVHLSLGEDRLFREDRVPPKSSVTIRMAKGTTLSEESAQGVKRLVAAAVPNLDIANVVILDEEGDVVGAPPPVLTAGLATPEIEEEQAIEKFYESRIREALRAKLANEVGVSVEAELPSAATQTGLASWTPAVRSFPLEVALTPSAPIDAAAQDGARAAALAAIASTAQQDDVVSFGVAASPAREAGIAAPLFRKPVKAWRAPAASDESAALLPELTLALLLVAAVVFGLALLFRRLRGPGRLSERRRAAFVGKLRAALDEGEVHAASRA